MAQSSEHWQDSYLFMRKFISSTCMTNLFPALQTEGCLMQLRYGKS